MLKRENRLTHKEFSTYRKGESYKTHLFYIKIVNTNKNISKLGIIIAKKNVKNRIERNSIKRKLCYYYNNILNSSSKDKVFNKVIIITYMSKEINVKYNSIKEELDQIFINNN